MPNPRHGRPTGTGPHGELALVLIAYHSNRTRSQEPATLAGPLIGTMSRPDTGGTVRIRKLLGAALTVPMLIGALLVATTGPAAACSCAVFRSEADRAASADAVFVGQLVDRVNRIDQQARDLMHSSNPADRTRAPRSDSSRAVLTFEVSRVYKGAVGNRQQIVTDPGEPGGPTCGGMAVPSGEPFLVFAWQASPELSRRFQLNPGQYVSGWCSGSRPLAHGGAPALGPSAKSATGGPERWSATTQLVVGVGVLAVGVAAGLGLASLRARRPSND